MKSATRIVAAFLIPCLLVDTTVSGEIRCSPAAMTPAGCAIFRQDALAMRMLQARRFFDSFAERAKLNTLFFSTESADYAFHPASHGSESVFNPQILHWADAFLLELDPYGFPNLWQILASDPQHWAIIREAENSKKPLFFPELAHRFISSPADSVMTSIGRRGLMELYMYVAVLLCIAPLGWAMGSSEMTLWPWRALLLFATSLPLLGAVTAVVRWRGWNRFFIMNRLTGFLLLTQFYIHLTGFRSAVIARKAEEIVAPLMRSRLGRRPRILIEFGSLHADLEYYLKHRWLRNAVIGFHQVVLYAFLFLSRDHYSHVAAIEDYPFTGLRIYGVQGAA